MKFTVNREKFQKALQRVGSIISTRTMLPVLSNVLIRAEDGVVELTSTDLEIRISTRVEAAVEGAGVTTAPARKLISLVSSFSAPEVSFDIDDKDHLRIRCGTGQFTLLGLPAEGFPEATEFTSLQEVKLKENEFKRMIGAVSYAVSADDARKVLTGTLFSIREGLVTLVATDGKRLAMQEKSPEAAEGGDGQAIIPLKALTEVRRLLENEGSVTVRIGEKQCVFVAGGFELATKLIEGSYPNYRQVIPASFSQSIDVPAAVFLAKLETVSLVLSDSSSYVILQFGGNQLKLQASSSEVGEGSDYLEIAYDGEPFEISFNPAYLADPLRNCDADVVRMKLNDPLNPVAVENNAGFLYVIMPIRKK